MLIVRELKNETVTDELIQEATKVLDDKEKKILPFFYKDVSYIEIGESLGMSRERARALVCKVIRKLRRELSKS